MNTLFNRSNDSNYFLAGSGPASLLSRNPSSLYLSRVIKRVILAFAKTKAQIYLFILFIYTIFKEGIAFNCYSYSTLRPSVQTYLHIYRH